MANMTFPEDIFDDQNMDFSFLYFDSPEPGYLDSPEPYFSSTVQFLSFTVNCSIYIGFDDKKFALWNIKKNLQNSTISIAPPQYRDEILCLIYKLILDIVTGAI